jgi:uncharacterized coiled-coil DUF342 family protein
MWITENWELVAAITAGAIGTFRKELQAVLTFKQQERQSNVTVESGNLDNLSKTMDLYRRLIDDIIPRYEAELKEYKEELKYYKGELEKYRGEIKERDKEIVSLHREINDLKVEIIKLKAVNKKFRPDEEP